MKILAFFEAISSIIMAIVSIVIIAALARWTKILRKQNEISEKQNEILDRQTKILEKQLAITSILEEKRKVDEQDNKTKMILAREGLVVTVICLAGALWQVFGLFRLNQNSLNLALLMDNSSQLTYGALKAVAMIYPIYLFLRFIVWAVNMMKKGNQ